MSGSGLHLAVTNLTAIFTAAAVDGLEVTDGPNIDPRRSLLLEVGWDGASSGASVTRARMDLAGARTRETVLVRCLLSAHDDRLSVAATRALLADAFDRLDSALRQPANARVGGAGPLVLAEITDYDYIPVDDPASGVGATASMPFSVVVTAAQ